MKRWHMTMGGGLDGLRLREFEMPAPGPGEVLVKLHAVSLNYRELSILLKGRYPLPVKPDVVACSDGAGEVIEAGPGVGHWKAGMRVVASIFPHWHDGPFALARAAQLGGSIDGMLAPYVLLPEAALVPVPEHLSFEEAAALPCAGVTAWNALHGGGRPLQPGDTVLTLGSGGVSLWAMQLAKAGGARVIATTSSADKAERLRTLGADAVLNYHETPAWAEAVRALTAGAGVQRVVEVGGGATLALSLRAVAFSGEVAFIGTLADGPATLDANALFASGATLRVIAAGSTAQLAQMARAVAVNRLRPPLGQVFGFDDARAAFAHYAREHERGAGFGKVVIRVAA
ncbi:NAD(P)-dependent alcohol dehydrogenase [Piscinibacter gummiphilus]|uniref:NAD(P)-dependent alcohol dehydrogenase n=1 Tax=Piscinibacter gummiphilus TaxID=946333 RepID=A0ABZ0CYB1_9BURK|nr:NAD(P)-dependent alcohol dehydrogenase [Piscinibacter gummiphilus]WOB07962.1 NAD(P)-dependent alcohol dehydrogenase [Piscinibacter gummiphilus]